MTTKHTPGPWKIKERNVFEIRNSEECCIIAMTGGWDEKYYEEERANALMIAASPDMYAALEACHEAMAYMSEYDIPLTLHEQVKAALDKASGII